MDVANLGLRVDSSQLSTATGRMNAFSLAGSKAHRSAGGVTTAMAGLSTAAAGAAAGVAGLAAAALSIGAVTRTIADFEHGMARVSAVSGATGKSLANLRDLAKELGSTTEFSATQAAGGMQFLAQAGFDANEIFTALPTTLDLATAAAVDMSTAADIASNILGGFQMQASELAGVADVLAMTTSKSNTNLVQLGGAMSFVAPLANAAGVSIEETASAIGVMSDAGIQGSRAGTSLSGVIRRLQAPSDTAAAAIQNLGIRMEDVDLRGESLAEVMALFAEKGLDAATAAKIFEAEAAPGALVLANNADAAAEFSEKLEQAGGSLEAMAKIMRDNLRGDINSLWSAVEGLVLELGDAGLTNVLRGAVQGATALVRAITELVTVGGQMMSVLQLPTSIQETFAGVGSAASFLVENLDRVATAGIALATVMITRTAVSIGTSFVAAAASAVTQSVALEMALGATSRTAAVTSVAIKGLTVALRTMKAALITTGYGALIVAMGEVINLTARLTSATGSFGEAMSIMKDLAVEVWGRVRLAAAGAMALMDGESQKATANMIGYLADVVDRAAQFGAKMVDVATGSFNAFVAAFSNLPNSLGSAMSQAANAVIAGVESLINGVIDAINSFVRGLNSLFAGLPDWATPGGQGLNFGEISSVSLSRMEVAGETMAQTAAAAYEAAQGVTEFNGAGDSLRATADNMRTTAAAATSAGKAALTMATQPLESLSVLRAETEGSAAAMDAAATAANSAAGAIGGVGASGADGGSGAGGSGSKKSLSGAASEAAKKLKELREEAARMNLEADPVKKYNAELDKLNELLDYGLSQEAYSDAIADLNDELASSIPMVDEVTGAFSKFIETGFSDFKGFVDNVWSDFKGLLADMASTALRNKIIIPMVTGVAGGGAGVAGMMGGQGGLGGLLGGGGGLGGLLGGSGGGGGLLGGVGNVLGAFGGGASNSLGALLSGGPGAMFGSIGAQVGTATATGTLSSIAGAAGSILGPIGIAAGVASLFKSTKEVVANGISVIFENGEAEISSYEKSKRTNGFGMSSGFSREYDRLDETIQQTVKGRIDSFTDALDMFGFNSNISGLNLETRNEIKTDEGESFESVLQEQIQTALDRVADYTVGEGAFSQFAKAGERVSETVERLSGSLLSVNTVLEDLGKSTYDLSLRGAAAASELADLFGGVEGLQQATANYFQNFYTEAEQVEAITEKVSKTLGEYNLTMPKTREQYRSLVEGANLSSERGRELYAVLLSVADSMNRVLPAANSAAGAIDGISEAMDSILTRVNANLDTAISGTTAQANYMMQGATQWQRTATRIADVLSEMRGTRSALTSPIQAFTANQTRFNDLLKQAMSGDIEAADQLGSAAQDLIESGAYIARTRVEQARLEAEVRKGLMSAEEVASSVATRHEVIAGLLMDQVATMEKIKELVNSGLPLDPKQINGLLGKITSLDRTIGREVNLLPPNLRDAIVNGVNPLDESLRSRVREPVLALRHSLIDLRDQLVDEAKARREEQKRMDKVNRLQDSLEAASRNVTRGANQAQDIISKVRGLERSTGADMRNGSGDDVLRVNADGSITYRATGVLGLDKGNARERWLDEYWGRGGLQDQIGSAQRKQNSAIRQVNKLREQILNLGGVPQFEMGGRHGGGARIVGESGPELEMVGASRVYTNQQTREMFDNSAVVNELKRMQRELEAFRSEQRQLGLRVDKHSKKTSDILRKWDALSVPVRNPDSGTKLKVDTQ